MSPVYSFRCASCKVTFTLRLKMKESGEPQTCPECDYPADRKFEPVSLKVYGGTPIHHKGD